MCSVIFSLLWKVLQFQSIIVLNQEKSIFSNVLTFNSAFECLCFLALPKTFGKWTHLISFLSQPTPQPPSHLSSHFLAWVSANTALPVSEKLRVTYTPSHSFFWFLPCLLRPLFIWHFLWSLSWAPLSKLPFPVCPPSPPPPGPPSSGLHYATSGALSELPNWFSHPKVFSILHHLEFFPRLTFLKYRWSFHSSDQTPPVGLHQCPEIVQSKRCNQVSMTRCLGPAPPAPATMPSSRVLASLLSIKQFSTLRMTLYPKVPQTEDLMAQAESSLLMEAPARWVLFLCPVPSPPSALGALSVGNLAVIALTLKLSHTYLVYIHGDSVLWLLRHLE